MTTNSTQEHAVLRRDQFAIGAAVNDDKTLASNLASSPMLSEGRLTLMKERGAPSTSFAYNRIIDATDQPFVILAHQDVYLPMAFERQLLIAIEQLYHLDPEWAVLGVVGKDDGGRVSGMAWSNGLQSLVGRKIAEPVSVVSLDELLLVLRRDSGVRFDKSLPGFHLYGTDVVLDALQLGLKSYVIDAPVVHNSVTVTHLDSRYVRSYRFMQKKWVHRLPLTTLIVPVSSTLWPIYRSHLTAAKRWLRGQRPVVERHPNPADLVRHLVSEEAS